MVFFPAEVGIQSSTGCDRLCVAETTMRKWTARHFSHSVGVCCLSVACPSVVGCSCLCGSKATKRFRVTRSCQDSLGRCRVKVLRLDCDGCDSCSVPEKMHSAFP